MNLYARLCERAAQGRPLRIGLIGAGKFGSMYLAQVPKTPGIHLVGIADLAPANARTNLQRVGWSAERYAAGALDAALQSGATHVGDDWQALVAHPQIDIIVEATGNPIAAVEHALAAFQHGKHVVMVTVVRRRLRRALHPQLLEVELALDLAEGVVVDLALVAQLDDGRALGADDAALDLLVLDPLLAALGRLVGVLGREVPRPVPEARLEPVEERLVGRPVRGRARSISSMPAWYAAARATVDSSPSGSVPSQSAQRRTAGRVRPWPTSVTRITANVTRTGSGRAPGSPSGSASAAASDTAPRRPAQLDHEGEPRRQPRVAPRDHPARRAGSRLAAKTHTSRVPTTTAPTSDRDAQERRSATGPRGPRGCPGSSQADEHEDEAVEDEPDHLPGASATGPGCSA